MDGSDFTKEKDGESTAERPLLIAEMREADDEGDESTAPFQHSLSF